MRYATLIAAGLAFAATTAIAQVPANLEAELMKIGQMVDPASTAKLYRPLMPASDFNTYWPPTAAQPITSPPGAPLCPGVTVVRDQSFGTNANDVLDILEDEKGGDKR